MCYNVIDYLSEVPGNSIDNQTSSSTATSSSVVPPPNVSPLLSSVPPNSPLSSRPTPLLIRSGILYLLFLPICMRCGECFVMFSHTALNVFVMSASAWQAVRWECKKFLATTVCRFWYTCTMDDSRMIHSTVWFDPFPPFMTNYWSAYYTTLWSLHTVIPLWTDCSAQHTSSHHRIYHPFQWGW